MTVHVTINAANVTVTKIMEEILDQIQSIVTLVIVQITAVITLVENVSILEVLEILEVLMSIVTLVVVHILPVVDKNVINVTVITMDGEITTTMSEQEPKKVEVRIAILELLLLEMLDFTIKIVLFFVSNFSGICYNIV